LAANPVHCCCLCQPLRLLLVLLLVVVFQHQRLHQLLLISFTPLPL
jgi:hypothetical protein